MSNKIDIARALPFSLEAEQSVLGSILIDPECFSDVSSKIRSEEFYIKCNREIFESMQELFLKNRVIDAVTLLDIVNTKDTFASEDESRNYIRTLAEIVPSSTNIGDYCKIIHDKYLLRSLIDACDNISESAYSEADDASSILDSAQQALYSIADKNEVHGFTHIRDALIENFQHLKLLRDDPESAQGQHTGFSSLDRVLVGMQPGDLVLIGARPGMGKTSFAMNIATKVAQKSKKAVCVFSLEMSSAQLVSRMLSSEALIDSYNIRSGNLNSDDFEKLARTSEMLSDCNILIDDTAGISVSGMRAKLRKIHDEIGLIVIDYLQLMQSDKRTDNRVQEVADISRGLKLLAKDLKVPVICCAQLSRGPESRENKRPMLSDLRDSGAIEQDADVVLFLYRDEYYDKESTQNTAEIIVAKNRHGSLANVKMGWLGQFTKFTTLEER